MVVTSKHRTHKVMEAAIRELMGAGTPPSFKFKDTHASIEFPSGYTIPSQATLEAKYDELLALEEDIQKTVMEGDLEVGTSNLFVDTQTGNIGIGTNSPIGALDINAGPENDTTPALAIRGGIYDESDLYVLNSYNVNTGVGYAAKVIGVNIKNKVETNNTVKIRDNQGGLTSAGAIYLGSDDENQGIFGVLGATGAAGTTLSEHLTVRAGGNVGIGTASPMNTGLHIANSYFASGGNTTHLNPQIFITGDSGTSGNQVSAIGFSGNSTGDGHQRMVAGSVYYKGGGGNYGMDGYLGIAVANSSTSGTDPYGLTEGELESHTRIAIKNNGNVGIGTTSPGIVLDVGSSLSNPQIGRNYATGSVHDADKRDAIYFGRWDGTGRDFLGIKCRVDTHTALGYGDYSNQTKLEFYTWGNNYASSREVMCIRGDGNVGIGTASPARPLTIESSSFDGIRVKRTIAGGGSAIELINGNDDEWTVGIGGTGTFGIYDGATFGEQFAINTSGNVGIGTTDPNRQLQIYGNSSNYFSFSPAEADDTSIVDNTNFGATSFKKQMMMRLNNRTWYWGIVNNSSNNLGLGADGGGGNDPDIQCVFQNNGTFFTKYLRVKENVGIGTTNPTHQLHIGPKDNDHIYLASSNNSYGWIIDTDDQGSGTVPFRIIKRTDGVDSTVLTIKNQDGNVGIGTTSPSHPLTIQETTTNTNTVTYPLAIRAISSGTVANGFGAGIRFQCERRDTNDYQSLAGSVEVYGAGNLPGTSDLWNMRFGVRNNDTAVTPMTLKYNGNVGIGTTSPGHILHVEGTSSTSPIYKGAGAAATSTFNYILNAPAPGTTSGGAVHFINGSTRSTDGGQSTYTIRNDSGALNLGNSNHATRILSNSFEYSNGDGSVTVYGPNTTWNSYLFVGAASDRNPNNNSDRAQVITTNGNLHLDAGGSRDIYMNYYSGNYIRHNGLGVYSDDRLKTDEELITNATETLLKLKPQRYTKAWTLNETELREPHTETGLIAQDIWYDAPELRHIVLLGEDANPSETKPSEPVPGDIQQDPDYSSWGPREAAVNYEGLIAYLIKSNQELYTEIQAEKARNDALEARIAALENA